MRITEAHLYTKDLPIRGGAYTMAGQTITGAQTVILRLVGEAGLCGWGEVCPLGAAYAPVHAGGIIAALTEMMPTVIGCEAVPLSVADRLDRTMLGQNYARAAIDIAVHDLLGRHLGVPVATLLGGARRRRVPSYYALGLDPPDETARRAAEMVDAGYPRLQIKIGREDLAADIATIRKVAERVGPGIGPGIKFVADANRGLTQEAAILLSMATAGIAYSLEQPCDGLAAVAALRGRIAHPIILDESITDLGTGIRAIGDGLADGFGMKITRLGGLRQAAVFRDLCAARDLPHTCDDSWGGDIIAAASVHLGVTVQPRLLAGVWVATGYQMAGYGAAGAGVQVRDGHLDLPDGPGLGITPDPDCFGAPIFSTGG